MSERWERCDACGERLTPYCLACHEVEAAALNAADEAKKLRELLAEARASVFVHRGRGKLLSAIDAELNNSLKPG